MRILGAIGVLNFFGDYVFTIVVQIFVLFGISVLGFSKLTKQKKEKTLKEFHYKKISKKSVFICILIGFVVYFLNYYIASFFYSILKMFGYSISSGESLTSYPIWLLILNIFFTAVLPAICEETAHRGMLLSQMKKFNLAKAIFLSSLLFGLLHLNIYQFFYATILGIIFAYLTILTDSIFPAMIIHFMNNALNVYMSFAYVNNLFSARFVNFFFGYLGQGDFGFIFLILFFIFLLFCLYSLIVLLYKESVKSRAKNLQKELSTYLIRKSFLKSVKEISIEDGEVCVEDVKSFFREKIDKNELKNQKINDFYAKTLIFSSIFLGTIITIFTFVWGII